MTEYNVSDGGYTDVIAVRVPPSANCATSGAT